MPFQPENRLQQLKILAEAWEILPWHVRLKIIWLVIPYIYPIPYRALFRPVAAVFFMFALLPFCPTEPLVIPAVIVAALMLSALIPEKEVKSNAIT